MTWRPKFSLRTLAIFTLLCTSGFGLWWHWEPWQRVTSWHMPGSLSPMRLSCRAVAPNTRTAAMVASGDFYWGVKANVISGDAVNMVLLWGARLESPVVLAEPVCLWNVKMSPDSALIAVAGAGAPCRIVDMESGEVLAESPAELRIERALAPVGSFELADVVTDHRITWSPDNSRVATDVIRRARVAGNPAARSWVRHKIVTLQLWETATAKLLASAEIDTHGGVLDLEFSSRGDRLLGSVKGGLGDQRLYLWDASDLGNPVGWKAHEKNVLEAEWMPGGQQAVSVGKDGRIKVWDARTGESLRSFGLEIEEDALTGPSGFTRAEFSSDRELVATRDDVFTGISLPMKEEVPPLLRIWDISSGRQLAAIETDTWAMCFSGDSSSVVGSSSPFDAAKIRAWDAQTGRLLFERKFAKGSLGKLGYGMVEPEGKALKITLAEEMLFIDPATGRELRRLVGRHWLGSEDGERLATSGNDGRVCIYHSDDYSLLAQIPEAGWAWFLDEGDLLLACHETRAAIYRRRRPEQWWGVFYLWELWLTAAFAGLFVWSVVRDRRSLRARSEPTE